MSFHLLLFGALGCSLPPEPPPSQAAVEAAVDRESLPPLYRKLYDYAFLPAAQDAEQRVRLRVFLRALDFDLYQLGLLEELHGFARREFTAVAARNVEITGSYEPELARVHAELWAAMDRGASDEELGRIGAQLDGVKRRETELLELRATSVRTVLDQERTFLGTLTPKQDIMFADAIFALRHRLDPWANAGDFRELVGSVYVAGEFGTLIRPTYDPDEDHLNIGGLWSAEPEKLAGPYFQDARREVILYMLLLEPTFPEALAAARADRARAAAATLPEAASPPADAAPAAPETP
jgi:hypothetical protein